MTGASRHNMLMSSIQACGNTQFGLMAQTLLQNRPDQKIVYSLHMKPSANDYLTRFLCRAISGIVTS